MKQKKLGRILETLKEYELGGMVLTKDGLVVVSQLPEDVNSEILAAMAAAVVATSSNVSSHTGLGEPEYTVISTEKATVVSKDAGKVILAAVGGPRVEIEKVKEILDSVAEEVRREIEDGFREGPEEGS
ncbi:MAG: hypothetical protein GXO63_00530 [Candidatus Micrarchaeota archaeon]|nr:hypothetical protein [Candidatus Micrarchaeota archaeon]